MRDVRSLIGAAIMIAAFASGAAAQETSTFLAARPVWARGRETEMNLTLGFRAAVVKSAGQKVTLRIAANSIYRAWAGGKFVGCGPARGPHGFYRVDEWDITSAIRDGGNVAIEVAGYNVNSFYCLNEPAFLQAEVVQGGKVIAATGDGTFEAFILTSRVQKTPRYSFQRTFTEVYKLDPAADAWQTGKGTFAKAELAECEAKKLLPRRVDYPQFAIRPAAKVLAAGTFAANPNPVKLWKDRSMVNIGPAFKGFKESDLAANPSLELQTMVSTVTGAPQPLDAGSGRSLKAGTFAIMDLGTNLSGFIRATVECKAKTRIWLAFDEILSRNDVDFKRLSCINLVEYELAPGAYALETIEPYTLRYLKIICTEGECRLSNVGLREYSHPPVAATFNASDARLNKLFAAGVETFRQNALDVFMDCPSRERAGWLCDSFFTSRVEADLTGTNRVEKNFFEAYLLPEKFAFLPGGMLPMCYPSDHNDGVYIPNWAMWFVVQLEEYAQRSGDKVTVQALEKRVMKLLDFLKGYENSDGLLEKLPRWVFVEWSAANKFVQDVNYPSNMLYAGMLSSAGRLYGRDDLMKKAEQIRQTIRKQAFDGKFFIDNAMRKEGKLEITRNRTETCQYYAFFFDVATVEQHGKLWETLRGTFGPSRAKTKAMPEIHPSNSFIGNMLRIELLSRQRLSQQILDESVAYLEYMADRTGTLWEHDTPQASCNHGFASHIVHTLYRDVLGIRQVDRLSKKILLKMGDAKLERCEGTMPLPGGELKLKWWREGEQVKHEATAPAGWEVRVER